MAWRISVSALGSLSGEAETVAEARDGDYSRRFYFSDSMCFGERALRDGALEVVDRIGDELQVSPQCGDGGAGYCSPRMHDKYARGALSIVIGFEREPRLKFHKRRDGDSACSRCERIGFDCFMQGAIRRENLKSRMICSAQNWRNLNVLIRVIKLIEMVEIHTASANKGFVAMMASFTHWLGVFIPWQEDSKLTRVSPVGNWR